jgi:hypothetical protein
VVAGSVQRGLAGIGREVLGVGGLRTVSATESLQTAAGTGFVAFVLLVLLPAVLLRLCGRMLKGQASVFARTAVAAFAVLLAAGFVSERGMSIGPRTASAGPRPAITPAQELLELANAQQKQEQMRRVREGTPEERHEAAVKRLSELVETISAPIGKQAGEFAKLGGLTPSTFTDSKSLEARIHLLMQAHANGEEALRLTRALPQTASKLADELGMDAVESTSLIREMTGDGTVDRMVKVRELDCRLFDLLESYLSMIRSNRSKWEVENGKLTFTDAAFAQKVGTVGREVQRVTREQERLEGEIKGSAKTTR